MIYKSDSKYTEYNQAMQLSEAYTSTLHLNDAFSEMKFSTMGEYKQALEIKDLTSKIIADMEYVHKNTTNVPTQLTENTFIGSYLKNISWDQYKLLDRFDYKGSDSATTNFQLYYTFIQRAGENFVGVKYPIYRSNKEIKSQEFQNFIKFIEEKGPLAEEKVHLGKEQFYKTTQTIVDIAVPRLLIVVTSVYHKQVPIIGGAMDAVSAQFNQIQKGVGNLEQKFLDWGNVVDNPVGQLINVYVGLGEFITMSQQVMGGVLSGMTQQVGGGVIQAFFRDTDEDDKDTIKSSLTGIMMSLFSKLGNLISGALNLAVATITFSISMFVTISQSILKIVKKIFQTSPVIQQIFNYLSLQLELFFLPFFTQFGTPILNAVMSIYSWVIGEPTRLLYAFKEQIGTDEEINEFFDSIVEYLDNIFNNIDTEQLYNKMRELIKAVRSFLKAFKNTLIDNQSLMNQLLEKGFETFSTLLKGDLIKSVLSIGTSAMEFVEKNGEKIISVIETMFKIAKSGLNVLKISMEYFYPLMQQILVGFGIVSGMILSWRLWQILSIVTSGALTVGLPVFLQTGATLGSAVGFGAYNYVDGYIINKDWISYYDKFTAPEFQFDSAHVDAFASGGKIPRRNGGKFGLMGEAGEGEWAIPKSKMKLFRGNNNVIIRINGKTYNPKAIDSATDELKREKRFVFDTN